MAENHPVTSTSTSVAAVEVTSMLPVPEGTTTRSAAVRPTVKLSCEVPPPTPGSATWKVAGGRRSAHRDVEDHGRHVPSARQAAQAGHRNRAGDAGCQRVTGSPRAGALGGAPDQVRGIAGPGIADPRRGRQRVVQSRSRRGGPTRRHSRSTVRSVAFVAVTTRLPPAPRPTSAALLTVWPGPSSGSTLVSATLLGSAVRYPVPAGPTAVRLTTTAVAIAGTPKCPATAIEHRPPGLQTVAVALGRRSTQI